MRWLKLKSLCYHAKAAKGPNKVIHGLIMSAREVKTRKENQTKISKIMIKNRYLIAGGNEIEF